MSILYRIPLMCLTYVFIIWQTLIDKTIIKKCLNILCLLGDVSCTKVHGRQTRNQAIHNLNYGIWPCGIDLQTAKLECTDAKLDVHIWNVRIVIFRQQNAPENFNESRWFTHVVIRFTETPVLN